MNASIDWLRKRGGYYSAHEVSRAIGRLRADTEQMLEAGVKSGELETREWSLDHIDKTNGGYRKIEGEPYRQYRVKVGA